LGRYPDDRTVEAVAVGFSRAQRRSPRMLSSSPRDFRGRTGKSGLERRIEVRRPAVAR
jgi:hypothetical protein